MKLSEIKDEQALDVLADLIGPLAEILADKEIANLFNAGQKLRCVQHAIKAHKASVIECLAILEGVPVKDYHCNILTLPMRVMDILNDEAINELFTLQSPKTVAESFGSVMVNTEVGEE